jgi:hypothetical protein
LFNNDGRIDAENDVIHFDGHGDSKIGDKSG